ncbi:MAG: VWA domain-containing protein [Bowdeniella nasicola]|nr:VWA domain-containing protein [Bowdeniella nasicola]
MSLQFTYSPAVSILVIGALLVVGLIVGIRSAGTKARVRRVAMVVAALAVVVGPTITTTTREVTSNVEVYLAVDLTGSMAAEDYNGERPRLEGVRHDVEQLVAELPGARFSVVSYSSVASRQLPLTTDTRAVRSWAETARQEITYYSVGSAIDRPVNGLLKVLAAAQERNPNNVRLLFLLTDGESTDGEGAQEDTGREAPFGDLKPYIDGGAVLGYGTLAGGKMRSYDGTPSTGAGSNAPYIIDPKRGGDAISRIDERALTEVARLLEVPYLHRTEPGPLTEVTAAIDAEQLGEDGRREVDVPELVSWPIFGILALLCAWELADLIRRMREVSRD